MAEIATNLQRLHELANVGAVDVTLQRLGVELLGLGVEAVKCTGWVSKVSLEVQEQTEAAGTHPGKRDSECGMKMPPSEAPFMAPKTRAPVEVAWVCEMRLIRNVFGQEHGQSALEANSNHKRPPCWP